MFLQYFQPFHLLFFNLVITERDSFYNLDRWLMYKCVQDISYCRQNKFLPNLMRLARSCNQQRNVVWSTQTVSGLLWNVSKQIPNSFWFQKFSWSEWKDAISLSALSECIWNLESGRFHGFIWKHFLTQQTHWLLLSLWCCYSSIFKIFHIILPTLLFCLLSCYYSLFCKKYNLRNIYNGFFRATTTLFQPTTTIKNFTIKKNIFFIQQRHFFKKSDTFSSNNDKSFLKILK